MGIILSKEFKIALSNLPNKEKDKLLFRLIKTDVALLNKLHFELVEGGNIFEEREKIKKTIQRNIEQLNKQYSQYFHADSLKIEYGYLSGDISRYAYKTSDKYGVIEIEIYIFSEIIGIINKYSSQNNTFFHSNKLRNYLIDKLYKLGILYNKLHPDYQFDFKDSLEELGKTIMKNNYLWNFFTANYFDINWLLDGHFTNELPILFTTSKNDRKSGIIT